MPANPDYADIGSGGKYGRGRVDKDRPDRGQMYSQQREQAKEVIAQMAQEAKEAEKWNQYKSYAEATQLANIATQRALKGADFAKNAIRAVPYAGSFLSGLYNPHKGGLKQAFDLLSMPNVGLVDGYVTAPTPTGYIQQSASGITTFTGMPDPTYSGPFAKLVNPPQEPIGGNDKIEVAPVDEVTGQCPDGYEFDENLNACRKITPTDYTAMTMPSVPAGRYARMGLLDQPPAGLLEAGFGSPADFAGANLAFRRATAPMSTYFTDPRSYEGYTLI